jgi:signal transduction histidine kinase
VTTPGTSADDTPLPLRKSLRGKGLLATLALLAYVLVAGLYVSAERGKILDSVVALERLAQHEKAVALAEAAVNGARVDVNVASNAALAEPALPSEVALYMESCAKLFKALDEFDPAYALLQRAMQRSYQALQASPQRANWIELREALGRAGDELEIRRRRLAEERDALTLGYQRQYDAVTVESLLLAVVGLAMFGSLAAWFFSRLAGDIRRLEVHARQIVQGTRGVALPVRRDDELGHLMRAVNRMATDLDEREKQIELDNQRRAHQDKMLSVGALAAGMAHEVNNPLAVIAGSAEALKSAALQRHDAAAAEDAERILAQAHRAGQAAQRLADAAAPQPARRDWIDLLTLVRRVLQWMGYDRRYRGLVFEVQAPSDLPAVYGSAEAVQRVLVQMLTLACDALAAQGQSRASPCIALSHTEATVELRLSFPAPLDFTQEKVQRGVLLGRAALAPLGAQLAFGQDPTGGSHIKLNLPMDSNETAQ